MMDLKNPQPHYEKVELGYERLNQRRCLYSLAMASDRVHFYYPLF